MPDRLTDLPNIGPVLARELVAAGLGSEEALTAAGSVEAARRLATGGRADCYNMLMALEGAIRGVRWHAIPKPERQTLKDRLDQALAAADPR